MTVGTKVVVALASLAGIGLGTFAITRAVAYARPKISAPPPVPGPGPSGPKYVGSGWTGWPYKEVFPDVDAFVQAFRRLGYEVDDSLVTERSMVQIGRFQQDYNLWSTTWSSMEEGSLWPEEPASPAGTIDEDERVGKETVGAMVDALTADTYFPGGWQPMIDWYAERA
jgi:hypothetical protein